MTTKPRILKTKKSVLIFDTKEEAEDFLVGRTFPKDGKVEQWKNFWVIMGEGTHSIGKKYLGWAFVLLPEPENLTFEIL